MPTISDKELERYKRIEDALRTGLVLPPDYIEFKRQAESALKPVSNRPTVDEMYEHLPEYHPVMSVIRTTAIKVLRELLNECVEQGIQSKVQDIISEWIEEYKAER